LRLARLLEITFNASSLAVSPDSGIENKGISLLLWSSVL